MNASFREIFDIFLDFNTERIRCLAHSDSPVIARLIWLGRVAILENVLSLLSPALRDRIICLMDGNCCEGALSRDRRPALRGTCIGSKYPPVKMTMSWVSQESWIALGDLVLFAPNTYLVSSKEKRNFERITCRKKNQNFLLYLIEKKTL